MSADCLRFFSIFSISTCVSASTAVTGFLLIGVVAFFLISWVSLVIPVTCLWISRNVFNNDSALADNIAANVVGLFLGFVTRFFAWRAFVFQDRESEAERDRVG